MKKDKKTLIISTVAIILLIIIVIGATYAYFKAQTGDAGNVPTQVTTNTTDSLVFETGSNITLTADTTTFAEGMNNRTGTTFARATLKANNKTNSATGNYYVYFDVTKNELKYTTETKKPELLLKITKTLGTSEAEEVTTGIEGVEYKTVTDGKGNSISGYDITEYSGLLTIVNNKEITSTSETVEKYDIEVILVNLDEDQTANGGKSFAGKLLIQKESYYPLLAKFIKELYTGTQGENNIYYHKNLAYSAEDESYRYAGSYEAVENYVCFGYDDETRTYASNWCPNDNLYRIIGVFGNQVKLIKADFATTVQLGTAENGEEWNQSDIQKLFSNYKGNLATIPRYYWSGSSSNRENDWKSSTLNTNALNTNFINSIGSTWIAKITTITWKVGGNSWPNIGKQDAPTAYLNEIVSPVTGQTPVNNKIGLMYVSDYMYGASPTYWTYNGEDMATTVSNWLYIGTNEWTITRQTATNSYAFRVDSDGLTFNFVNLAIGVRPVFYLESSVTMTGGSGTPENPYRVS